MRDIYISDIIEAIPNKDKLKTELLNAINYLDKLDKYSMLEISYTLSQIVGDCVYDYEVSEEGL